MRSTRTSGVVSAIASSSSRVKILGEEEIAGSKESSGPFGTVVVKIDRLEGHPPEQLLSKNESCLKQDSFCFKQMSL